MEQLNKTQFIVSVINELFPDDFNVGHYIGWSHKKYKNYHQQNWAGREVDVIAALQQNTLQQIGSAQHRHFVMLLTGFCPQLLPACSERAPKVLFKGQCGNVTDLLAGKVPVFWVFFCFAVSWNQYFQWQCELTWFVSATDFVLLWVVSTQQWSA